MRRESSFAVALAFAVSALFVAGTAGASERNAPLSPPSVSSADGDVELARRRARQKKRRPKQEPPAAATPTEPTPAQQEAVVDAATRRGPTRVEFDERLLQGQTNKANAIYLFQRRESALRSLVKKREHFHAEIDEALE